MMQTVHKEQPRIFFIHETGCCKESDLPIRSLWIARQGTGQIFIYEENFVMKNQILN
jgi:hypothetical protein